jgi:hypothetical protein
MASTEGPLDNLTREGLAIVQDYTDPGVSSSSKRDRLRTLASKVKAKTKDTLSVSKATDGHPDSSEDSVEDELLADAAFSPFDVADDNSSDREASVDGISGGIESAKQISLHPRRAMLKKATKTAASKISSLSKPYLSSHQQRDFLDAHDNLANAKSNASFHAFRSTSRSLDIDVEDARGKIAKMEAHRESLETAWAIGRHVDRVRVVQRFMLKPHRSDFVNGTPTDKAAVDWPRYLARLVVYYTYCFTSRHIDDLESPPFDIRDLTLTVERLAMISGPWQTFFLSCREVYTWKSPKRTLQWAALFWTLWYTNHTVGYFYFWIIYATIRNRYYPSSVSSIRESMTRSLDKEKKAQAWSELIDRHGSDGWMEPLLDELGPMIQLQLGDLVDFLEVLSNFYRWERPYKTAQTLFVALVLFLITLFCDMTFCVKLVWLNVGGAFFLSFPIATNWPMYRRAVNLFRWFFWDVPSNAELGIIRLQEKATVLEARARGDEHAYESWESNSEYETASEAPAESREERTKSEYRFRAYRGKSKGDLFINRSGTCWSPRRSLSTQINIPFIDFREMRKLEPSSQSKSTKMLRPNTVGLLFIYDKVTTISSRKCDVEELELHVTSKDRHKIFNLILAWSGQKWQPLATERHRNKTDQHETFDKALKRALQ